MKLKIPGQPQLPSGHNNGFVMILAVLIIAAVISSIIISVSLGTVTLLEKSNTVLRGEYTRYYVEGCMQEALIQISMDDDYGGGTHVLAGNTCSVVVSGIGNNRTIMASGSSNGYYRELQAEITLSPFSLDSWGD